MHRQADDSGRSHAIDLDEVANSLELGRTGRRDLASHADEADSLPLITPSKHHHLARRVSPTRTHARTGERRENYAPHFPSARASWVGVQVQVAQAVLLVFLLAGLAYIAWDTFGNPTAKQNVKYLETESIPKCPSTDPVPKHDYKHWITRMPAIARDMELHGSSARMLFIGDSITQAWGEEGASIWNSSYAPRHALNLGVGADQTQHVLWRLRPDLGGQLTKVGSGVDLVVLSIGTNNARYLQPPEETVLGIQAIVKAIRDGVGPAAHILVLAILPRADALLQFQLNQQVNARLRHSIEHTAERVFVYDLNSAFMAGGLRLFESQLFSLPDVDATLLAKDKLHLTTAGYQAWHDALEPVLQRHLALVAEERRSTT